MTASMESIIRYCTDRKRICPQPNEWNELWKMLPNKVQVGAGWKPALPLILAAWWDTSPEEKQKRLLDHLRYADVHGALEQADAFLRDLDENAWFHEGD